MKNYWKKIKNWFSKIRQGRFRLGANPENDWFALLLMFVVLALVAAYFGNEEIIILEKSGPTDTFEVAGEKTNFLDEKTLQSVLDFYEARQTNLDEYRDKPPKISNPAL